MSLISSDPPSVKKRAVGLHNTSKSLIKNVLRHTDTHNRMLEESEMWQVYRRLKQKESRGGGQGQSDSSSNESSSGSNNRKRLLKMERLKEDTRKLSELDGSGDIKDKDKQSDVVGGGELREPDVKNSFLYDDRREMGWEDNSRRGLKRAHMDEPSQLGGSDSTFWMRQLQRVEETDPDRWGHAGFKELYPDAFDSDRSDPDQPSSKRHKKTKHHKKYSSTKDSVKRKKKKKVERHSSSTEKRRRRKQSEGRSRHTRHKRKTRSDKEDETDNSSDGSVTERKGSRQNVSAKKLKGVDAGKTELSGKRHRVVPKHSREKRKRKKVKKESRTHNHGDDGDRHRDVVSENKNVDRDSESGSEDDEDSSNGGSSRKRVRQNLKTESERMKDISGIAGLERFHTSNNRKRY